ncbi:MAG: hypothetical protein KIT45_11815 [Fimbriimonadia bacterium]|nr:hypothetical protein [Fimbriimonadia bacterium]
MNIKNVLFGLLALMSASLVDAQPFTYQGYLRDGGVPANGTYDLRFQLWTMAAGGSQIGAEQFVDDILIQNGLITTPLNFGNVWDGGDRYLAIAIRLGNSNGGYQELAPRVKINPTPYAHTASNALGLQGRSVSNAAPANGQILKWDGNTWMPSNDLQDALWQTSGNNILYNNGNVALGGNTFTHRLNVQSTTSDTLRLIGPGGSFGWNARLNFGDANYVYLQEDEDDKLTLFAGRIALMGGNVGIGTTNPLYLLHVEAPVGDRAIYGNHTSVSGTVSGVYGQSSSTTGRGVFGQTTATTGTTFGGRFESASSSGRGVFGFASSTTGATFGVLGQSNSVNGRGVFGLADAATGNSVGVYGQSNSTSGTGVYGYASATSGNTTGGRFETFSPNSFTVQGLANATIGLATGVYGRTESVDGTGVSGYASASTGGAEGVWGESRSTSSNSYGVRGTDVAGAASHAVFAEGSFAALGTKSFQIDHPLHPETHYLNHFCTESSEPLNAYSGNVVTDAQGYATVHLPDYFESVNREFRYQLTIVDGAGEEFVLARVVRKIQSNRFVIRTNQPHVEVSWRVEAIRNDPWVQRYGFQTEQEKEDELKGKYLSPELYGQPKERGLNYRPKPESEPTKEQPK